MQYPVIRHNGKEYIYLYESLFCTAEINKIWKINYISIKMLYRTARKSNKSILKEINPEYSLEELMLKLKLQ